MSVATILIVDDENDNLDLLDRYVRRDGFETKLASSGFQALDYLSTHQPDLILLDWMMPELSGIEVLRSVRERYDQNQIPIIMCTALNDAEHISAALSEGANDFVTKPIDRTILKARVVSQIKRKQAATELALLNERLEQLVAERTRTLLKQGRNAAEISSSIQNKIVEICTAVANFNLDAIEAARTDAEEVLDALMVAPAYDGAEIVRLR